MRLNSQSVPAPHWMLEDIRNRQRHPNVSLGDVKLELSAITPVEQDPDIYGVVDRSLHAVDVMLSLSIANRGALKSTDTFLLMKPKQGQFGQGFDRDIATFVRGSKSGDYMWHLNQALPPQSEIGFRADYHFQTEVTFHPQFGKMWTILDEEGAPSNLSDVAIEWTIFADSAPVRTGRFTMGGIGLIEKLNQWR